MPGDRWWTWRLVPKQPRNMALALARGGAQATIAGGLLMMVVGFVENSPSGFLVFQLGLIAVGVGLCILLLDSNIKSRGGS